MFKVSVFKEVTLDRKYFNERGIKGQSINLSINGRNL